MQKILFMILLGFVACSEEESIINITAAAKDDASITSINGTWKAVSFEDYIEHTVEFPNEENSFGLDILVTFDDTNSPPAITGTNTTNAISGNFEYVGERRFKVNSLASTKVAQPRLADEFNRAVLFDDVEYTISETTLRLYYAKMQRSITFTRQ